jgi:hypothetical protein
VAAAGEDDRGDDQTCGEGDAHAILQAVTAAVRCRLYGDRMHPLP